jgi:hypothetical protein
VSSPGGYFDEIGELFARAATNTGVEERSYRIAGHDVVVRCAGDALLQRTDPALTRACEREGIARGGPTAAAPSLVVELFDSVGSGVDIGPMPWSRQDFEPLGIVEPFSDDRYRTAVDIHTASLSVFDRETATARFWLEDATHMAYWQSAEPLRLILSWWAATIEMQLTHVAAVAGSAGAALLVGGGGAGKSTTSLSCLAGGLGFLGDDYCLVAPRPEPTVHRVYNTAKLLPAAFDRLPGLRALARNADRLDREKAVLDLVPAYTSGLVESAPVCAIAIPRITGRFAVRPVSRGSVLRAMAPSTVFGLLGATPESLATLADVARRVPGYEVELGDDVDCVVSTMASLVS